MNKVIQLNKKINVKSKYDNKYFKKYKDYQGYYLNEDLYKLIGEDNKYHLVKSKDFIEVIEI